MSIQKARLHFLGQEGCAKLNCGQTIANAFKEKFSLSDKMVEEFAGYGGGHAPQGLCGAFYAAKVILKDRNPDKLKECESSFLNLAGSTKCKDIRLSRALSCVGCVEKVAQSLETI